MQELAWLLEPIRIWIEGGSWQEIKTSQGFMALALLFGALVPSSLIAMGIGVTSWRETPFAAWLGVSPHEPHEGWAERARDIDKDGTPDF